MSNDPKKDLQELKDLADQRVAHEKYVDEDVDPEEARRARQLGHLQAQFTELERGLHPKKPQG